MTTLRATLESRRLLSFPFPWRRRLAQDGALLGSLTRIFVESVQTSYAEHAGKGGKTGAITVIQRTSSDLRLNPHVHVFFLDGVYREQEDKKLVWVGLDGRSATSVVNAYRAVCRRLNQALLARVDAHNLAAA